MITIGIDAHKRLHVAVAVDEAGRELGEWQGTNTIEGWQKCHEWAEQLGAERRIGVEGAGGYGRGLAQYLVSQGESVYEVNPRWTALARRSARSVAKSDHLDAHAVASVVRQNQDALPKVYIEDESAVLNLLTTERDDLVSESVRIQNQLHALLGQVEPPYQERFKKLTAKATLRSLEAYTAPQESRFSEDRAEAVRRLAARLALIVSQLAIVTGRICEIAAVRFARLKEICGVNYLTAGVLAALLGPVERFSSDAQLAAYAGVAPLQASSAGKTRHRLNRGGNRRLNAVVWRIAITQARSSPEARAYLARRVSEGKTKREAFRALKRFIVRAIWRLYREETNGDPSPLPPSPAAGWT